jgi:hypothetical protein
MLVTKPALELTWTRPVLEFDEHSTKGRILRLLRDGFFNGEPKTPSQIRGALQRTGPDSNTAVIGNAMADLVKARVFTNEGGGYKAVPGVPINEREVP